MRQSICWDCRKASGLCDWTDHWKHMPIPGWQAEKTFLRCKGELTESYLVIECPEFDRDAYNGGKDRKEDYEERLRRMQTLKAKEQL